MQVASRSKKKGRGCEKNASRGACASAHAGECAHGLCEATHCPDWALDRCLIGRFGDEQISWYRHENVMTADATAPAATADELEDDAYGEKQIDSKSENRKQQRTCSFREFMCGYEDGGKAIKGYHQVALEFFKHRQVHVALILISC